MVPQFLQTHRKVIAAAMVLAGFVAALAIAFTAAPPPDNPLGYRPEDTKRYLRELEVYGGKINILASDIREWFVSLWHGKTLAVTVAVLSIAAALVFLLVSTPLPPSTGDGPDAQTPG